MNHYPDNGCRTGGPSCLACPLPVCVHDERPMSLYMAKNRANDALITAAVNALDLASGQAVAVVAQQNSISSRSVQRAMKRQRDLV